MSATEAKDYSDADARLAAVEKRMNTRQAEYRSDVAALRADLKTDIANLARDDADRHSRLILSIATMLAGTIAILGVLMRI